MTNSFSIYQNGSVKKHKGKKSRPKIKLKYFLPFVGVADVVVNNEKNKTRKNR